MAVDISQVNPFPRVYRLFQYPVDHGEYTADLITACKLGNFVQYTGQLDFIESPYLRPGEAYLLRDKETRERFVLGCGKIEWKETPPENQKNETERQGAQVQEPPEKGEEKDSLVFTLLRPDVDIEAWLEKTSPYFLPDHDPSRLQLSWLVREGLKKYGVLHHGDGLYQVTFPEEMEEARVILTPGKETRFSKNTPSARDWASKLEHFVQ